MGIVSIHKVSVRVPDSVADAVTTMSQAALEDFKEDLYRATSGSNHAEQDWTSEVWVSAEFFNMSQALRCEKKIFEVIGRWRRNIRTNT